MCEGGREGVIGVVRGGEGERGREGGLKGKGGWEVSHCSKFEECFSAWRG